MTKLRANGYRASCKSFLLFSLSLAFAALTVSCGGSAAPNCALATALNILPSVATGDHSAAPPANQTQFLGFDQLVPGCPPTPSFRTDLKWTVSDPVNVTIGNTPGPSYGVATCVNATAGPVTVTASGPNIQGATITGTAALTCK
jgi:hypothetical protein